MVVKPVQCPNCGGSLHVSEDGKTARCEFCHSDVIIEEPRGTRNVARNLFFLAKNALDAGNNEEAYQYYNRVLEISPTSYAAWIGKAQAAGWMSTLSNFRSPEMISGINKALEYAPENKKELIRQRGANIIHKVSKAHFELASEHFVRFASLETSHQDYIDRCQLICQTLAAANSLCPNNKNILKNMITILRDSAKDKNIYSEDRHYCYYRPTTPEYKQEVTSIIQRLASNLKQLEPTFQIEPLNLEKKAGCFIVTATMGDPQHPYVIYFKKFRDTVLLRTYVGRCIISLYYKIAPFFSNAIKKYKILRLISYKVLIRPAIWFLANLWSFRD